MKFYPDEEQAKKVRALHKKLTASKFPYSIPITSKSDSPYIVQSWVDGEAADYERKIDRSATLSILEALHVHTRNWTIPYMPRQNLLDKWQARLVRFQQHEQFLRPLMGEDYEAIRRQATFALEQMPVMKEQQQCILHGDVVHHNFLLGHKPVLIDFDLACLGDPADEVILWMHRVLSHVQYDVESLLVEQPYTRIALSKMPYLRYPNEVLREWLYVVQVGEERQSALCDYVRAYTKEMLAYYPKLNSQIARLM